jgi:copper resistance protein B
MHIKTSLFAASLILIAPTAWAGETPIFHKFQLETDYGGGSAGGLARWDFKGWAGGDTHKLWLKSEGQYRAGNLEDAEVWALYSRAVSTFWDVQAGLRRDIKPYATSYLTVGLNGLAPYFIETEAHLFVSDAGDVSLRLRGETDFLFTQQLILQPYVETRLFATDIPAQDIGAGLSSGQVGLQTRYEITRKLAPYFDISYSQKFGRTASFAEDEGQESGALVAAIGLRLMF